MRGWDEVSVTARKSRKQKNDEEKGGKQKQIERLKREGGREGGSE